MLEKRKGRGGGGGGGGSGIDISDNWDAPPLLKAQMAFEIIWFCIVLYLISLLAKAIRNVPSHRRQPYILLLVSAIFLDIGLIMRAITMRIDVPFGPTSLALHSIVTLLWQQPIALITMAGLWVFRKRSQLLIYGEGATGIPYAGQMWKFVVDWTVTSCGLVFLLLAVIVNAVGYSLYYSDVIGYPEYLRYHDAQIGLSYVLFAFYFILTIIFVVTGFTLSAAFKQQMGKPDVVRHFPTV